MIRHTCDDQVPVNREGLLSVCGAQPPWKLVMIEDHMPCWVSQMDMWH